MNAPDAEIGPDGRPLLAADGTVLGVVRPTRVSDAEAYRDLIRASFRADPESRRWFVAAEADLDTVLAHIAGNLSFVLDDGGRLLASCSARMPWSPNPAPFAFPHLSWITSHPDQQGRGLGRLITDAVVAHLDAALKAPAVSLGTAREHAFLVAHYARLGWRPFEDRDLGLGHITRYFIRVLDPDAVRARGARLGLSAEIVEELTATNA